MVLRAAWMWGFQVSLGSSGKQRCALSWALLSSSSRSCHLQQPRAEWKLSSCNTDLAVTTHLSTYKLFLPLTYIYPTLCPVSTRSSEVFIFHHHFSFPLRFLTTEWNPRKQNIMSCPPLRAANILQNKATSWLCLKPSPRSHSTDQHTPERAAPGFTSLNIPNTTSPNLMDSEKPRTSA